MEYERLREFARIKHIKVGELERVMEMSQGTLSRKQKALSGLNTTHIRLLAYTYPDLSMEWLIRGTGEMFIHQVQISSQGNNITIKL